MPWSASSGKGSRSQTLPACSQTSRNSSCISASNDSSEFTLFAGHMGTLSLPSLTTLTLVHVHYSSVGPLEDLASNVVFLIQRSKCDLRKLTIIDQRAPDAPDALHDVLVTCPNLAELDIPKPTAGFLNRLTLHPTQRTPILPYLTHLKIHCDAIEEDDERTVSIPALMRLVLSREGGLNCLESDSPPFRCLQEVYLDSVNLSILQRDITLWECERIFPERYSAGCWRNHTSCQETLGLAKAAAAQLHSYWIALQQNKVYLHVYMETDRTIRNLEKLHAERLNMLVFLRTEVVHKLAQIYQTEVGDIALRGSLLQIRDRISRLCQIWKPTLIRNVKACPYLWRVSRDGDERYWRGHGIESIRLVCWKIREDGTDDAALSNFL
ncbi:hypothetical protein FA13DRAFT_479361 [Coprinellus micaceus]|uniref:Uncharacterized protein n=1 Tax=Coprinellus micaceus TaxID=71717 RepID=A0A4Y7TAQ0_COPMI|nr:hypothetical protein FA13DRAFT_479361 [Coprinellus micaceus]